VFVFVLVLVVIVVPGFPRVFVTWVRIVIVARVTRFNVASAVEEQLLDIRDTVSLVTTRARLAVSAKHQVNICSMTGTAIVFWILIRILAFGAICSRVELWVVHALFAIVVGVEFAIDAYTLFFPIVVELESFIALTLALLALDLGEIALWNPNLDAMLVVAAITWILLLARFNRVVIAFTALKGLVLVRFAMCCSVARARFAVAAKDQVHIRSGALAAVVFRVVISVFALGTIGGGIQFGTCQALSAIAVLVHTRVSAHAFVLAPVKHKAVIAYTFSCWAFVR
jgi:hypothetical protein